MGSLLKVQSIETFNNPWAMTFVNDDLILVTTRSGTLWLVSTRGAKQKVTGVPASRVGGQGGLGDIVIHPNFPSNMLVYFSLVESDDNEENRGAAVFRGKLKISDKPALTEVQRIWTQIPKRPGHGHFSHRIVFGPAGSAQEGKVFITSGDRQEKTPAQRWDMNLGKIIRINDDGSIPEDNPFQGHGKLAKSFWTLGHRNSLGIAFDAQGQLWASEMGPKHGDELNLIKKGKNYGWPIVSNGNNYNGTKIPNHDTRPDFVAPAAYWVPSIAPSGLIIYSKTKFSSWFGQAFIGGLKGRALIRVKLKGDKAREAERFSWGKRIREIEEGPNGYIWVLEDSNNGRLLRLAN